MMVRKGNATLVASSLILILLGSAVVLNGHLGRDYDDYIWIVFYVALAPHLPFRCAPFTGASLSVYSLLCVFIYNEWWKRTLNIAVMNFMPLCIVLGQAALGADFFSRPRDVIWPQLLMVPHSVAYVLHYNSLLDVHVPVVVVRHLLLLTISFATHIVCKIFLEVMVESDQSVPVDEQAPLI